MHDGNTWWPESSVPERGIPSKDFILKVDEWINHVGRRLISNLKWLTAVSGAAVNAYRFNSKGFKLGHTVIKSAKLVERSLTAVFPSSSDGRGCWCALHAAAAQTEQSAATFFQLNPHKGRKTGKEFDLSACTASARDWLSDSVKMLMLCNWNKQRIHISSPPIVRHILSDFTQRRE